MEKLYIPKYDNREEVIPGEVAIDYEKCSGCALCNKVCPADSLVMEEKKPKMKEQDKNECMGCGDCAAICPEDAITLISTNRYSGCFKTIDRGEFAAPRLIYKAH
jgi:ferredoxin